jgi:hypothetical protein
LSILKDKKITINLFAGVGGMSAATSSGVGDGPVVDKYPSEKSSSTLVISGGEGYIDFRVGKTSLS